MKNIHSTQMKLVLIKLVTIICLGIFSLYHTQETERNKAYYKELLQKSTYNNRQGQNFPAFTYQSAQDKDLKELRIKYRLDSVAGKGSDINKIKNLVTWMHMAVPHEDEENLHLLTAQNIIETYKQKKLSQGCYPLAIAMNEILLSMGFKSRIVICFSEDFKNPNGGHVINSVYVPSLKKWIWADPQYNAYLKNEQGNFLSIAEVREYVTEGKPIFLNDNADYHGEKIDLKDYMEDFMIEFLYRFISPIHSTFNSETRESGKILRYVELLPSNSNIPPKGTFETHKSNGIEVITYHTNNPDIFWGTKKIDFKKHKF